MPRRAENRRPQHGGVIAPLGDTYRIFIHNVISKAKYTILIGGSLADSILSNIVQHGSAAEAVTVASGWQNLRNVTIANIGVVKDADSLGIRGGPPRANAAL